MIYTGLNCVSQTSRTINNSFIKSSGIASFSRLTLMLQHCVSTGLQLTRNQDCVYVIQYLMKLLRSFRILSHCPALKVVGLAIFTAFLLAVCCKNLEISFDKFNTEHTAFVRSLVCVCACVCVCVCVCVRVLKYSNR